MAPAATETPDSSALGPDRADGVETGPQAASDHAGQEAAKAAQGPAGQASAETAAAPPVEAAATANPTAAAGSSKPADSDEDIFDFLR